MFDQAEDIGMVEEKKGQFEIFPTKISFSLAVIVGSFVN